MKSDVKYGIVIVCIRFFDVTAPIIMNHDDSSNTDTGKDSRMENLKNLLNELKPKENK